MEKNKENIAKFDYDFENDSLFIFPNSRKPEEYGISECIDENFILDFNKEKKLIGLEILSASERLGIPKSYLKNISKWNITINIDEKNIKIDIKLEFKLRNKLNEKELSIEKINEDMLTPSFTNLAMA